ncbi:MAG: cupin domain-containing protein [Proteobacteria bacterium]|nr:cupin domain-containing protein [Pseudomonadota bacterium]
MRTASYWIKTLHLTAHPEGGFFRETYRADITLSREALPGRYGGKRTASTAIYFLLESDQVSVFHRIRSDELWHFYHGSPLDIHMIEKNGAYRTARLGPDHSKGERFQIVVNHGIWMAATVVADHSYTLTGCTVSPGFEFSDFELADREILASSFPEHAKIIRMLSHG